MAPKPKVAPGKMGVNKWDEELAKRAKLAAGVEESAMVGGSWIRTRGGVLSFNGAEIPGNKLNVIILDHILENHYYPGRFDPKKPNTPSCYAFARKLEDLVPHEKCSAPQSETCKGCPMNDWGTADTGKGKACANSRRLAVIPESGLEDIEAAEVAYVQVPVTSVKGWAGYVDQLNKTLHRPPFAVLTELSLEKDEATQFKMKFRMVSTIDDGDSLGALLAKADIVAEGIAFPYPEAAEEEEAPAPKGKAKPAKFAAPVAKGRR